MSVRDNYSSLSGYPLSEERLQRNLAGARQRLLRRRLRRASARGVLASVLCMALVLMGYRWMTSADAHGPLRALATELGDFQTKAAKQRVPLDDGSVVSIDPGATLRVVENTGTRFTTALAAGKVKFLVKPDGPRTWTVEAGPVRVEVLGTLFSVEKGQHEVAVRVTRGHVLVRGTRVPNYTKHLYAGDSFQVALEQGAGAGENAAMAGKPLGDSQQPDPLVTGAEASAAPRQIVRTLGADMTRPSEDSQYSTTELLAKADAARKQGRPREAEDLLVELLRAGTDSSGKGIAALTLGRLRLDILGNPRGAAEAFDMALRFGLPADLAEQAQARRIQALARSGDEQTAREQASEYRQKYGHGTWRARVDSWAPAP